MILKIYKVNKHNYSELRRLYLDYSKNAMDTFIGVLFIMCVEFCFCLNCKSMSGDPVDW